jgi:hypothetical protein
MYKTKKMANSPLQPTYPCFDQDLGDSAGAGNLPMQICKKISFFQNIYGLIELSI